MQNEKASIFTAEQEQSLRQLKTYFPYRIVWGAVNSNGEFEQHADYDRRKLYRYLRNREWLVATIE